MRIGYDLDGVLAIWTAQNNKEFRDIKRKSVDECKFYGKLLPNKSPLLKKQGVIITSRPIRLYATTLRWLKKHKIRHNGLFCVGDAELSDKLCSQIGNKRAEVEWSFSQAKSKAFAIMAQGLDCYIEDRGDVVTALTLMCPKTNIIHYEM